MRATTHVPPILSLSSTKQGVETEYKIRGALKKKNPIDWKPPFVGGGGGGGDLSRTTLVLLKLL